MKTMGEKKYFHFKIINCMPSFVYCRIFLALKTKWFLFGSHPECDC